MSQNPAPIVYRCAADLYRAIMEVSMLAPDDADSITLPEWRTATEGEAPEFCTVDTMVDYIGNRQRIRLREDLEARSIGKIAMHGPTRDAIGKLTFAFSTGPARSSFSVVGTRPRLLAMAETVRKNWILYGGGAKPEELTRAPTKRKTHAWPTCLISVWRAALEEKDYSGAMLTGDSLGTVYFGAGDKAFALAAPMQVDGLPEGFASARRCDGRWVVTHMTTGHAIEPRGYGSRKVAEAAAIEKWSATPEDKRAHAMKRAADDVGTIDHEASRAAWCKARNIEDPRAPLDAAPLDVAPVDAAPLADVAPAAPVDEQMTPMATNEHAGGENQAVTPSPSRVVEISEAAPRHTFELILLGVDSQRIETRVFACAGAGLTSADIEAGEATLRRMAVARGGSCIVDRTFSAGAMRAWCIVAAKPPAAPPPAPVAEILDAAPLPTPAPSWATMLHNALVPLQNAAPDGVPERAAMLREAARIEAVSAAMIADNIGTTAEQSTRQIMADYCEVARSLRELAGPATACDDAKRRPLGQIMRLPHAARQLRLRVHGGAGRPWPALAAPAVRLGAVSRMARPPPPGV